MAPAVILKGESHNPVNLLRHTLSQAKTWLYRRPKAELQRLVRWGPVAYFRSNAWAREMEAAAWELPVLNPKKSQPTLEVWFLTGKRFWYQTAFCAWTLAKHSGRRLTVNLVDDGTLDACSEDGIRRLFPQGLTVTRDMVQAKLDLELPAESFPVLRARWSDYVHIRKLIDIHVASSGVKLVLDSDMLFFARPDALLQWWDAAQNEIVGPCLMTDCEESYGYSRKLMSELTGSPIPALLNVGVCGLRSEELNWVEMERWCRVLFEREGTSYYLEQALVAMMASRRSPVVMPKIKYITFPSKLQVKSTIGVLQHYVADSKPWYFGQAWRSAIKKELG